MEEISILFSALELDTETMYFIVIVCPNKLNEANLNSFFPLIGKPNCLNELVFFLLIINGHMGIVAENETIVDASSSNGKVVHRDLDEWWRERFIVGFRIFDSEGKLTEG